MRRHRLGCDSSETHVLRKLFFPFAHSNFLHASNNSWPECTFILRKQQTNQYRNAWPCCLLWFQFGICSPSSPGSRFVSATLLPFCVAAANTAEPEKKGQLRWLGVLSLDRLHVGKAYRQCPTANKEAYTLGGQSIQILNLAITRHV